MKGAILALCLVGAGAFAPPQQSRVERLTPLGAAPEPSPYYLGKTQSLAQGSNNPIDLSQYSTPATKPKPDAKTSKFSGAEYMLGAGPETGGFWDPLGLSSLNSLISDSPEHYGVMPHPKWLREAEIKHGRICMLAFLGVCAQAGCGWSWPGSLGGQFYESGVNWFDATASAAKTCPVGIAQIVGGIGLVEGVSDVGPFWSGRGDREAGDLDFYPFGKVTGAELEAKQISELKNGRLAMIGVMGFASAHLLPGSVPFLNNVNI